MSKEKSEMKLYKCRVRLAGLVHHEVPKFGVTDKEVAILRDIHGADAVVGFKTDGTTNRTNEQEYSRLAEIYGAGIVTKLFGNVLGVMTHIEIDDDEEVDVPDVSTAQAVTSGTGKPPSMNITQPPVELE